MKEAGQEPDLGGRGTRSVSLSGLLVQPGFLGYVAIHASCLTVIWVGWSPIAVAVAVILYLVRMFAVTGFYHRYFSHRTFKVPRVLQFAFALVGVSAAQRGPIWWAAHHRHHHRCADREGDIHSPRLDGLWWSHVGWIWSPQSRKPNLELVPDLTRFPELRLLDRFHVFVPLLLAVGTFVLGWVLSNARPDLGTSGLQMLIWGFSISTVALYHGTYTINSLAHRFGTRRYETRDDSRNNLLLALITLGEGWHNNHHCCPGATRQGFFWWEIDLTFYLLWVLERLRLIRDIQKVPVRVRQSGRSPSTAG